MWARKFLTFCLCDCACGVFANCEADADCKLTICRYLVAVNVCVFVYSTLQFVQLAYTVILGISFIPSILISTWLTFGCDQVGSFSFSHFQSWVKKLGVHSVCFGCSGVGQSVSRSCSTYYYIMERCNDIQHNIGNLPTSYYNVLICTRIGIGWDLYL